MSRSTTCRRCRGECLTTSPVCDTVCLDCWNSMQRTVAGNNKRARKARAVGKLMTEDWLHVLLEADFRCEGCGTSHTFQNPLTLDHKYPLSRGGMNNRLNIQPLCKTCHTLKDGDPETTPWNQHVVMARRQLRNRSQQFMVQLRNQYVAEMFPPRQLARDRQKVMDLFYDQMRKTHKHLQETGQFDGSFGKFMIETLLDFYMEKHYGF